MTSGVYEIFNPANGKRYVGPSKNIEKRWTRHRIDLSNAAPHCLPLQRAWNKYGEDKIKFRTILTCAPTRQMLKFYEQQLLDKAKPEYNILQFADSRLGAKASVETRQKMSRTRVGHPTSDETKRKIGATNKHHAAARSALITPCPPDLLVRVPAGAVVPFYLARERFEGREIRACWAAQRPVILLFDEEGDQGVLPMSVFKPVSGA